MVLARLVPLSSAFLISLLLAGCRDQPASASGVPLSPATKREAAKVPPVAPYDVRFMDAVSRHHEEAIRMIETAAPRFEHAELEALAKQVRTEREDELRRLAAMRRALYPEEPVSEASGIPGSETIGLDTSALASKSGDELDRAFIELFIEHHEGAVTMAEDALLNVERPDLRELAEEIVWEQEKEIDQMRTWVASWSEDALKP